jgi:four helix bundle protein
MSAGFAHEKLRVYQHATEFVGWAAGILDHVPEKLAVYDQLDRASISISLNIAEASSRFSATDRCRFFDNARGSALECAACLDVLVAKQLSKGSTVFPGKQALHGIVCMLFGLIRAVSPTRMHEDGVDYRADTPPQNPSNQSLFDHEDLRVYQDSLRSVTWFNQLLQAIPKSISVWNQLDRSSTSICLNIAEGNGKFTNSDRARFFHTAYGCALRCAAGLDLLAARTDLQNVQTFTGKELLRGIAAMLVGLIKSNPQDALREMEGEYRTSITE